MDGVRSRATSGGVLQREARDTGDKQLGGGRWHSPFHSACGLSGWHLLVREKARLDGPLSLSMPCCGWESQRSKLQILNSKSEIFEFR